MDLTVDAAAALTLQLACTLVVALGLLVDRLLQVARVRPVDRVLSDVCADVRCRSADGRCAVSRARCEVLLLHRRTVCMLPLGLVDR